MKVFMLSHSDVQRLLPMSECIPLMAEALISLAKGKSQQPVRTIFRPAEASGLMGLMPSYRSDKRPVFGLKAVCVFPGNPAKGKDAHQGAVMLFSADTGELMAIENASAITAIRTAAVSAVATDLLARKDAGVLAIIGAGIQGRAHLEAISQVRKLTAVRVADKIMERTRTFVDEMRSRYPFPILAMKSLEAAVAGAEIIVTVTNSSEPVVRRDWVAAGAHLNAVGACVPSAREMDSPTVAASKLFVDKRESILQESGDYLFPLKEGLIGAEHIRAEIGEVLSGAKPGRESDEEITLYKSLGLAVEDLAAAEYVYRKAQEQNLGMSIEF
jgi:ornithine cyclodeaminase/alanine dehydrogenase-like protein (mu-crystallin family)